MDRILHGLNDAQRCAVTSPAAVLQVLAPPGSGKTKTLTSRVGHLIANNGLQPRHIIVCTFTVKSAREMQERIAWFLGKDVASNLILGTFHSISRRFLAAYGKHIGLDEKFGIADSSDTLSILTRIVKRHQFGVQPAQARSRISSLKSQGIHADQFARTSKKADQQEIAIIYAEYEDHLHVSNLLDFDDLLVRCVELLRVFPTCVANIDALLIDEFQDTNNIQYDLMKLFAQHKRAITIVGDPDQSIYGWRNAEIRNLHKMQEDYPDTCIVKLEENYRSSGAILLSAQEVIEQDLARPSKRLMPTRSVGLRPILRRLPNAAIEACWIVSEIKRSSALTGQLFKYSDYSILVRSASLSRHIESALGKEGIPYRMVGGHKFFDRMEVKLTLDYLRVLNHPDHNDALARIINVPSRKIGSVTIQRLFEEADERRITLWMLVLGIAQGNVKPRIPVSAQSQAGLEIFTNLMLTTRKKLVESPIKQITLEELLAHVINKIDLERYLKKAKPEEFDSRWANVQELIALAADFSATMQQQLDKDLTGTVTGLLAAEAVKSLSTEEALSGFLANVALSTEVQKNDDKEQRTEQVTISTIHAAKGLEWPIVFIPAAYEGSIPHSRAEDTDEERRLLYVAMTRAQSLLYLSNPNKNSTGERTTLSPFLSQKPMESYFDSRGPVFDFTATAELASILGRAVPSVKTIEQAVLNAERVHDDRWLLEEDDDEHEQSRYHWDERGTDREYTMHISYSRSTSFGFDSGHRRAATLSGPTMDRQNEYSLPSTNLSTKFMTAATALATLNPTELTAGERRDDQALRETNTNTKKRKLIQEDTRAKGQQRLSGFFTPADPKPRDKGVCASEDHSEGQHSLARQKLLMKAIQPEQSINERSREAIQSASLTSHNTTDADRPNVGSCAPGAILHKTTVQQLNNTGQRKTLGVRRSLIGWEARNTRR